MISVLPLGGAVQVLPKPGKGLSLQEIGKVEIRRSSLVEFDADRQKWYIKFIDNSAKCTARTDGVATESDFESCPINTTKDAHKEVSALMGSFLKNAPTKGNAPGICKFQPEATMFFDHYDEGVRMEVYLLESWRKAGLLSED